MESERKKHETTKRELADIELEKESLLQEFKKINKMNPMIAQREL